MNYQDQLDKLNSAILATFTQLASIALYIPKVYQNRNLDIQTDGSIIKVGNKFFEAPPKQQVYKLIHCMLHTALRHHQRLEVNNNEVVTKIWMIATDVVVNELINSGLNNSSNYLETPEDIITLNKIKPYLENQHSTDLTAEKIFEDLYKNSKEIPLAPCEDISPQKFLDTDNILREHGLLNLNDNPDLAQSIWQQKVKDTFGQDTSSDTIDLLGLFPKPRVNWQSLLRQYLRTHLSSEKRLDYKRPSRRYLAGVHPYFTPAISAKPSLRHLVVCLDTSGSCFDTDTLKLFISNIDKASQTTGCEITLISFDYNVTDTYKIQKGQSLIDLVLAQKFSPKGGGGTSFHEPVEAAVALNPDLVLFFTDCEGSFPDQPKNNIPIIWATIGETPPWGKTIKIED